MKAIIVEDEKKSGEVIKKLIALHPSKLIEVEAVCNSVAQAIATIEEVRPALVFLDIDLPDGTGFDILEKLNYKDFQIIFTTAYDSFAIKAIKYSAVDYLLKPIDVDELHVAIDKVLELKSPLQKDTRVASLIESVKQPQERLKKITISTGNAYEIISLEDLIRCEADTSYTKFFMKDGRKFLVSSSLKVYEDMLPPDKFVRIHHHHLINMDHVVRVLKEDGGYAIMTDGSKIEISRRKKENFFEQLTRL